MDLGHVEKPFRHAVQRCNSTKPELGRPLAVPACSAIMRVSQCPVPYTVPLKFGQSVASVPYACTFAAMIWRCNRWLVMGALTPRLWSEAGICRGLR